MSNSISTGRALRATEGRRAPAKSNIYASEADHRRLTPLIGAGAVEVSAGAAVLQDKLDRALTLAAGEPPARVVRLGSTVRYRTGAAGPVRTVSIVLPEAADIDTGKVSVIAPVGAALFGLPVGAEFAWEAEDGAVRSVTVLGIEDGAA